MGLDTATPKDNEERKQNNNESADEYEDLDLELLAQDADQNNKIMQNSDENLDYLLPENRELVNNLHKFISYLVNSQASSELIERYGNLVNSIKKDEDLEPILKEMTAELGRDLKSENCKKDRKLYQYLKDICSWLVAELKLIIFSGTEHSDTLLQERNKAYEKAKLYNSERWICSSIGMRTISLNSDKTR
ncbi:MAG: hypothetical protein SFT68_05545 [Rickettsiaceae bacterium]|nr:hypothetical protein [Rickettsiaceae bacterium]